MFTFPNLLSFLRLPLALAFFQENPIIRATAIVLAMISDGLDGYYARKYRQTSKIGVLLDPLTDKLFVFTILAVFIHEQRLTLLESAALLSRDFSVAIFGAYLAFRGDLSRYKVKAIWSGKITTALQFAVLFALTLQIPIPPFFYLFFVFLGVLALIELTLRKKTEA